MLWILCLLCSAVPVFADGMVFPEVLYPKVEIPNQQALIHFSDRTERLVIETSFLGEGTNFAWVVPLPSPPEVKPVSESFFNNLRQAFQPRLTYRVHPYYAGLLFVCGLAFLGARALRDTSSVLVDLPLCVLLAVGAGLVGKNIAFGIVALGFALVIRLFSRSPAAYALILLMGTSFAAVLIWASDPHRPHLIETLGSADSGVSVEKAAGVTVVSVQRAGVFDATTIRGRTARDVLDWLQRNGYETPKSADPAIKQYIDRGWVFVASKARIPKGDRQLSALHPLAFIFTSDTQVYPTSLTAVAGSDCSIDLYVFGNRRAAARRFAAVRCDRLALNQPPKRNWAEPGLRIFDPEVLALVGNSTVGTKLSARLSPAQMASDTEVGSTFFWSKGRHVYSHSAARTIALNVALPLATLAWLLAGLSRGGWDVNERWVSRWRWRSAAIAVGLGLAIFLLLPKVEVESVRLPPAYHDDAATRQTPPSVDMTDSSPGRSSLSANLPTC